MNINNCRGLYFKAAQMNYDKFCAGSKLGNTHIDYEFSDEFIDFKSL